MLSIMTAKYHDFLHYTQYFYHCPSYPMPTHHSSFDLPVVLSSDISISHPNISPDEIFGYSLYYHTYFISLIPDCAIIKTLHVVHALPLNYHLCISMADFEFHSVILTLVRTFVIQIQQKIFTCITSNH